MKHLHNLTLTDNQYALIIKLLQDYANFTNDASERIKAECIVNTLEDEIKKINLCQSKKETYDTF